MFYCDTSALMKLYVEELHTGLMHKTCAQSANISLSGQMTFCCFDKTLNNAARILGMKVLEL
jgi:hypothetical protein